MPRRIPAVLLAAVLTLVSAVEADAQYFGRNKVQYRSFDFQIIRTEHFDVYYYDEERDAALDAARMVERSYARLSRILQHEFEERKPLILYASHTDFQQTNAISGFLDESTGGVTESLKSRMIVPFTGSYADFDHVLTHELVHGFQYDVIFRRPLVSDATSPFMMRLPLWFMEGMAEYLSIGRVDAHTVSWLRDAVLNGYLRSIDEMSRRDDYLSYRFGQSLWAYIGTKWGDEVIGILLQKAPRVGVERAFASTLGLSLGELNAEWQAALRSEFLVQLTEYDRPAHVATELAARADMVDPWFLAPALSPDGEEIVYLSQQDGFSFDLWLADARTGERKRRLVESARSAELESLRYMNSGAAFSPDGRYLVFVAKHGGRDALNIYDLERRRITSRLTWDLNGVSAPSWAPDGKRIVFTGLDGGISDLFITTLDGELTRLTNDAYADLMPAWSPDGRTIAFTTDRQGAELDVLRYGNMRVAVMDLASLRIDVLPHQEQGKNINPAWSPDGRVLAWVSDRSMNNNLYLYELDTARLSRVTNLLGGIIAVTPLSPVISWSRSGRLAFTYFEKAGYSTYVLEDPRALPRSAVVQPPLVAAATGADSGTPGGGSNGTPQDAGDAAHGAAPDPLSAFTRSLYRGEDGGLRPSSAGPPSIETAQAPVSVMALLDSAAYALPEKASFELQDYRARLTTDMIGRPNIGANVGDSFGNGVYGGSYISLSDMLGNHNMLVAGSINGSLADAQAFAGYSLLRHRANLGIAAWQQPLYRYLGGGYFPLRIHDQERLVAGNVFLRDMIRGVEVGVSYPFSTFRRLEVNATGVLYDSQVLYRAVDVETYEPVEVDVDNGGFHYAQPEVALVFDNSLMGWTGPIVGRRYRLQLSRAMGGFSFNEALVDFRQYLNWDQKLVFATRLVGISRFGGDAHRFARYWGSPYFLRGYDYDSFSPRGDECDDSRYYGDGESVSTCPVRDQLVGSSAAFVSAELRVPVVKELQIGFVGSFPPIDAIAFFDAGMAWDSHVCGSWDYTRQDSCAAGERSAVSVRWDRPAGADPYLVREPLFSWGVGLRINVFYTVLGIDYAIPVNRPDSGGRFSFSFGPAF